MKEEKKNISVDTIFKTYDNDHLLNLAEMIEFDIESNVVKMWSFYSPEDLIKALNEKTPIPELEYMINQSSYLNAIENELNERDLLTKYREKKAYIDFEMQSLMVYKTYDQRFRHLIYMKLNGFLESDYIRETILGMQQKEKESELSDDPSPNILA